MGEYGKRQYRPERRRSPGPMAAGVMTAVLLTLMPVLLCRGERILPSETEQSEKNAQPDQSVQTAASKDGARTVLLLEQKGEVTELTMEEYLWGVVAAEMPASFQPEALKAQACAARTYTVNRQSHPTDKHPQAHVCADSSCCQAYVDPALARARWGLNAGEYSDKITRAVEETDGLGILYGGVPIQALFFSSAAGRTIDAVEVWGNDVAYLKGVDSPEGEEVPNYRSQVVLSAQQVRQTVLETYPGADLSGEAEGWFSLRAENSAGGVASMLVGGVTLTGGQLRTLFALRSTNFTVRYEAGSFIFDVVGYGHGVGMSQYGANALAAQGQDFRAILTWYYTGAQVDTLW